MSLKPSGSGGLFSCKRVVVVGANGAGKTFVACRLGAAMDLPVIHNDALALTTNWARESTNVVREKRDQIAKREQWIIEGGPSVLSGQVLARAEVVVWLDLPRGVRVRRIMWRSLRYMGQTRPEHPPGNHDWPGLRQARFAQKAWARHDVMRASVPRALDGYGGTVVHLRDAQAVSTWLADMQR